MKRYFGFLLCICAILFNSACSIQISQAAFPNQNRSQPADESAHIPVTWGSLNLTGRLIYIVADFKGGSSKGGLRVALRSLDLVTGTVTTIFETEVDGWIRSLAVAPNHKELVISYAPPPDVPLGSKEELYIMPLGWLSTASAALHTTFGSGSIFPARLVSRRKIHLFHTCQLSVLLSNVRSHATCISGWKTGTTNQ